MSGSFILEDMTSTTQTDQLSSKLSTMTLRDFPGASSPIALISSAVRRRLPRLPMLRRTLSADSITFNPELPTAVGSASPNPEYESAVVLRNGEGELACFSDLGNGSDSMHQEVGSGASGISWKFANQGLSLLELSAQEASSTTENNPQFTRQIYLHSLTYLLRGLPSDLTVEEQMSLRASLPPDILEAPEVARLASSKHREPSLLHRTLASSIVQFFIIVQFLLPYMKVLLQALYQYEREHHVSERILKHSIGTLDILGKRSITITAAIYEMGDGKVGQYISELASWVIEGVVGGINEGLGEGMVIIGARPPPTAARDSTL